MEDEIRQQEVRKLIYNRRSNEIIVSHVTVRLSISFLLLKMIILDIIAAFVSILFYSIFLIPQKESSNFAYSQLIPFIILLMIIKISITIFVIMQWLFEYYEITPRMVIYRKGIIFKKEEKYKVEHLGLVKIEQGIVGKVLNYGTINLHNWMQGKDQSLYLIHNPLKYMHILEHLLPATDQEKKMIREKFIEVEE
jgi:hypothetical protein